uniref:Uncharacterized protein n=1 Tax=Rhizophora mucronata TaxID=61149 RepID=A0A2P2PGD1_RHIMU
MKENFLWNQTAQKIYLQTAMKAKE